MRHVFPSDRIAGLLGAERGLTSDEVEERRRRHGANDIVTDVSAGWTDILRDTARDPMVWFLAATALLFAWLGDIVEAIVMAVALLPIAGMDAWLHRRTQATTAGLAGRLAPQADVLRGVEVRTIASRDLVPGDLAIIQEGQPFPADGVIVSGANLQVDESTLTGEAMPVRKRPYGGRRLTEGEVSVESEFWGAAGTRLLTGQARVRVVFTGGETLYGQIVRSAREGQHGRTPLQTAIGALVTALVVAAVVVCVALAATRYYQGFGLVDAFLSAVTLAVAALPEEFPVVFTFYLGVGVYRLARRQALVRRSVVVENIGRVTCICCDKTGTMTEGRLRLAHALSADGFDANELRHIAAIASRPESGDPLDLAILEGEGAAAGREHLATFPFTEDRRREVAVVRDEDHSLLTAVKGAPETVLAMSPMSDGERAAWSRKTEELAATGHKVIACARRRLSDWIGGEPDRDFEFAGLLAFEDPVRDGVREAVAKAQAAGLRVIMVTGDHVATAVAVAHEIGIGGGSPNVVEGVELANHLARNGRDGVKALDVVARAIPAQKLDLVRALRASGEIVAVTGDGVNDVPALQGADIGIAMGERGTRTAREVASIVLLDDNFRTIVRAVAEGRQLFRNLKLSFAYLLMVHMPLVATAALVPFAGFPLLYLPMHVVWLELIIHPTALLVFQELPAAGGLGRVRRDAKVRFFDWREWALIGLVGGLVTVVIAVGYARSLGIDNNVEHARTMALVALVVASATTTAGLSRLRSMSAIIAVAAAIGSALALVQIRPLAEVLHLSPLHLDDWLIAGLGGLLAGALAAWLPRGSPH
jgi:Ca2+-transporting ATPase